MEEGTVDVWHGEIGVINNSTRYEDYYTLLTQEERQHADGMSRPQFRCRYVEVRARLRLTLAEYLDESPGSILIGKTEHGKPYLTKHPDLFFNLSHSGEYMLIGLTKQAQLGIDVEIIKFRKGFDGIVGKCFSEQEAKYWQGLPEEHKTAEFFRFWTAKEAFVKAVGRGISLGLNKVEITVNKPSSLLHIPNKYGNVEQWTLQGLDIDKGLSAAVCINSEKTPRIQVRRVIKSEVN